MSAGAAALLRALAQRAGVERTRMLVTDLRSDDWQSLTMVGERHEIALRLSGPDALAASARLCDGLEEAEFALPRQIVADIVVTAAPTFQKNGEVCLSIEALTIEA